VSLLDAGYSALGLPQRSSLGDWIYSRHFEFAGRNRPDAGRRLVGFEEVAALGGAHVVEANCARYTALILAPKVG